MTRDVRLHTTSSVHFEGRDLVLRERRRKHSVILKQRDIFVSGLPLLTLTRDRPPLSPRLVIKIIKRLGWEGKKNPPIICRYSLISTCSKGRPTLSGTVKNESRTWLMTKLKTRSNIYETRVIGFKTPTPSGSDPFSWTCHVSRKFLWLKTKKFVGWENFLFLYMLERSKWNKGLSCKK